MFFFHEKSRIVCLNIKIKVYLHHLVYHLKFKLLKPLSQVQYPINFFINVSYPQKNLINLQKNMTLDNNNECRANENIYITFN